MLDLFHIVFHLCIQPKHNHVQSPTIDQHKVVCRRLPARLPAGPRPDLPEARLRRAPSRPCCRNRAVRLLRTRRASNIDVNVSVGTIFSIYRRVTPVGTPVKLEDFLQKGNQQVAAGYIIYGTSTMLVYTTSVLMCTPRVRCKTLKR